MSGFCNRLALTVLAMQARGVWAGVDEDQAAMSWVYGASHIAIIHTKLGVRTLEVEMGVGKPALRGDMLTVTTKLFTTENDGLQVGRHLYSNATKEEALTLEFGKPNYHAPPGLVDGAFRMRLGGKRKLVMPPKLAYGEGGNEAMGVPNTHGAPLLFYVEAIFLERAPENPAEGSPPPEDTNASTSEALDSNESQETQTAAGDGEEEEGASHGEAKVEAKAELQRKAAERLKQEVSRAERQATKEAAKEAKEAKRKQKQATREAKARRGADDGEL